ncbi:hypothetical protein V8F06_003086 [Rhypophila decipiens]
MPFQYQLIPGSRVGGKNGLGKTWRSRSRSRSRPRPNQRLGQIKYTSMLLLLRLHGGICVYIVVLFARDPFRLAMVVRLLLIVQETPFVAMVRDGASGRFHVAVVVFDLVLVYNPNFRPPIPRARGNTGHTEMARTPSGVNLPPRSGRPAAPSTARRPPTIELPRGHGFEPDCGSNRPPPPTNFRKLLLFCCNSFSSFSTDVLMTLGLVWLGVWVSFLSEVSCGGGGSGVDV